MANAPTSQQKYNPETTQKARKTYICATINPELGIFQTGKQRNCKTLLEILTTIFVPLHICERWIFKWTKYTQIIQVSRSVTMTITTSPPSTLPGHLQDIASCMDVTLAKWAVLGMPRHRIPWAWRDSWNKEGGNSFIQFLLPHPLAPDSKVFLGGGERGVGLYPKKCIKTWIQNAMYVINLLGFFSLLLSLDAHNHVDDYSGTLVGVCQKQKSP